MAALTQIEEHIYWNHIRRIGNQRLTQLTPIVPIIGYLIIFGNQFQSYFEVFGEIQLTKLYFLYYGFTFVAVGTVVYNVFCPARLKDYGLESSFVSGELNSMHMVKLCELLEDIYDLHLDTVKRNRLEFSEKVKLFIAEYGKSAEQGFIEADKCSKKWAEDLTKYDDLLRHERRIGCYSEFLVDFLSDYYELLNRSLYYTRLLCSTFYAVGFVLILIPTLQMFIEVSAKVILEII